jgi:alditol oxidase
MADLHNWADNLRYSASGFHSPSSVDEIQELVSKSAKVKALGTRHSFSGIADTTGDLISLESLCAIEDVDRESQTVSFQGGVRYGELCRSLNRQGYAVPNLASLPHISIVGACATGTHGSGVDNGCLATAVSGIEIVTADGELVTLCGDDSSFNGAVVNLGAIGIATRMTLKVIPAFTVRQYVFENLPVDQLEANFEQIMSSAYSVSLFTDWQGSSINQVWIKSTDRDFSQEFFGGTAATQDLHPIKAISAVNCNPQMGVAGPWHKRLPHFRLDYMPSAGAELQSEYLLPREQAVLAMRRMRALGDRISPLLQISEIRAVAADDLWMSPCYHQDSIAFHFTWKKDWDSVRRLLPDIESELEPFGARPHWGKLFTTAVDRLRELYPRMDAFRDLLQQYDPSEKFLNAFHTQTIG